MSSAGARVTALPQPSPLALLAACGLPPGEDRGQQQREWADRVEWLVF